MDKIIKIIFQILAALALFLAGWFSHAWKNREEVKNEVKKAIADLNEQHEKALKSLKGSYEERLKKKDEIIHSLQEIIDRLLKLFENMEGDSAKMVKDSLNSSYEGLLKL